MKKSDIEEEGPMSQRSKPDQARHRHGPHGECYEGASTAELTEAVFRAHIDTIGAKLVAISRLFDHDFQECARQLAQCTHDGDFDDSRTTLRDYLGSTDAEGHPDGLSAWLAERDEYDSNLKLDENGDLILDPEPTEEAPRVVPAGSN